MWIILGLLLAIPSFALESFEKLKNVKMLRVLPNNIVMLNRGIEDGIMRNDHIKVTNEVDGFGSRAICIKASATTSYWRLYRVPNGKAFSMDYTYTIQGIANREIPFPEANILDKEHKIVEPEKKQDAPNPFDIKSDLPSQLSEKDLIRALGPERRKLIVEEAINKERLRRDFREYLFSVYASPFTRQSINNGENFRYGFRGGNVASKYRFTTFFDQQQSKMKDPVDNNTVSTRSTNAQAQFMIYRIKKNISTLSLINYDSYRFSRLATPKYQWQLGGLGFTWHIYESKINRDFLEVSYIPLLDIRETEVLERRTGNETTIKKNGLRHGFRLAFKKQINERVSIENLLWYRPFQDSDWNIYGDDMNLKEDFRITINLASNFYFDYNLIYMRDILWRDLSDLKENNTINSLNLRYDFEF